LQVRSGRYWLMTPFKKGIALIFAGGFIALISIGVAFPQAVSNVQLWVGGLLVSSSNPLPVTNGSGGGITVTGNVGGYDIVVTSNPIVQTSQYASGASLGGLQTLSFFRTLAQPSGILNNLSVSSKAGAVTPITLYIFNANPTSSTCTDKTAFSLAAADITKLITALPTSLTMAAGAIPTPTTASLQSPVSVKNSDSTLNLYACPVAGGAFIPSSTTDLFYSFAGIQD
jgi:hypothetical protein